MPSLAAGAAAVAHVRRMQGIHGASAGGVILPPGTAVAGESDTPSVGFVEKDLAAGTRFAHQVFPHEVEARQLENRKKKPAGEAKPPRTLGSESVAMFLKPPNSLAFWIEVPITADNGPFPSQTLTFPLVAELMGLVGHSRVTASGARSLLRRLAQGVFPKVKIGFTHTAPTTVVPGFTWWELEEERFELQSGGSTYPLFPLAGSYSGQDVWALTGAAPYEIPIGWTAAPRPLDALVVGKALDGHAYKPHPSDWLYPRVGPFPTTRAEREAGAAYAAMGSGEKAAQWAAWAAGDPATQAAWKTSVTEFAALLVIYEAWEKLWTELVAIPSFLDLPGPPAQTAKEAEEIAALEAAIKAKEKQSKECVYEELSNAEKPLRQAQGPFMNGVEDYLYRMDLRHPPGGLPDMTKGGWLVIEFSGPPGARWLGQRSYEIGMAFDWPFTNATWQGSGAFGPPQAEHVLDNFEVSRGGHGTPGTMAAGPHAVAKLAS